METRRNILAILGLAAAATPVLATEKFDTAEFYNDPVGAPGLPMPGVLLQQRIAEALESAAAAVRSGELTGTRIKIKSDVKMDNWLEHKVTFTFELSPPQT